MLEKLLKPKEFCEIVGISYRTFKRWVSGGRVNVVRTLYGMRSHRKKRLVECFKKLVEEVGKGSGESS